MRSLTRKKTGPSLDKISDESLLHLRMCDLNLTIQGTWLESCIKQLYQELTQKQFPFMPVCYLGDEWFSPDGYPVIAIPFYLAHPRLIQLEQKMMLEVEGGSAAECMQLLRHECGHAVAHAFGLTRRIKWRKIFGSPDKPYQDFYRYRPYSKSFVHHLKDWYAQSHPEEDFAETFAVWLTPESNWRMRYLDWPAIKKLQYVDCLIPSLKLNKETSHKSAPYPYQTDALTRMLKTHYDHRKKLYVEEKEDYFDQDLKRIFCQSMGKDPGGIKASAFITKNRKTILASASKWTTERKFMTKRLLTKLTIRCRILHLVVAGDPAATLVDLVTFFTSLISNYIFTSRFKEHP